MIRGKQIRLVGLILSVMVVINGKLIGESGSLEEQEKNYQFALLNQERSLKASLQEIKKEIAEVEKNIKQVKQVPSMEGVALQEALADERDMLFTIQQTSKIPYSLKVNDCKDLSPQQKKAIDTSIQSINKELQNLKSTLQELKQKPQCSICRELQKQYDWQLGYLKQIQEISGASCPQKMPTNVKGYASVSNLKAENWVLGKNTLANYYLELFQQTSQKNTVKCPQDKPYVLKDKKDCAPCPQNQYFDLTTRLCAACPQGQRFSASEHICSKQYKDNQKIPSETKCTAGQFFDFTQNKCLCPTQAPYFNGEICIQCISPQYFNEKLLKCDQCQEGTVYNPNYMSCRQCPPEKPALVNKVCIQCQPQQYFDQKNKKCEPCPNTQLYNKQTEKCECPNLTPYFDNTQCIKCDSPKFFNPKKFKCDECTQSQVYNQKERTCVDCPSNAPLADGLSCVACKSTEFYKKEVKKCLSCPKGMKYIPKDNICSCPETQPFYNGQQCFDCPLPKFWNEDTKKCEFCQSGKVYNVIIKKCDNCPSNKPLTKEGICYPCHQNSHYDSINNKCQEGTCPSNYVYDQILKKCVCSKDLFDNGDKCIKCQQPRYWDHDTKKCKQCDSGFEYKVESKSCEKKATKCSQNYIYDDTSKKCKCPTDFPFDSGTKCVSCYLPKYWELDVKQCLQCPKNNIYSTTLKRCARCPNNKPIIKGYTCQPCSQSEKQKCQQSNKCPSTYDYNQSAQLCVCKSNNPFDNGQQCVECPPPKKWDYRSNQCS